MAHNIDSMAYVAEVPWHGLGVKVGDQNVLSSEMIVKAGLDWEVARNDVFVRDLLNPANTVRIPGQKAIQRTDNGRVLSIMSDGYRPVQNTNKFSFFDEVVGQGKAIYHTAMSLDQGRKIAILAKLPGEIRVAKNDVTEKYLLLADSFDGTIAFTMALTPVRVVCQNTLNAALAGARKTAFRLRHSQSIDDKVRLAQQSLGLAIKAYDAFEGEAKKLVATRFSEQQMRDLTVELFPANEDGDVTDTAVVSRSTLLDLFENGKGHEEIRGTAWAALNAVAEYTDHYRTTRKTNGKSEGEARTISVLFGAGQNLKQKASNAIYKAIAA